MLLFAYMKISDALNSDVGLEKLTKKAEAIQIRFATVIISLTFHLWNYHIFLLEKISPLLSTDTHWFHF